MSLLDGKGYLLEPEAFERLTKGIKAVDAGRQRIPQEARNYR